VKYITLYTSDNSIEAKFIRDRLAQEGIASMATNENFATLMPHLSGMLGSGIQILVRKDNYDRAKRILEKDKAQVTACPNCNSNNIKYGLGTRHRFKKMFALLLTSMFALPSRHIKQTYYCDDCKHEFGG